MLGLHHPPAKSLPDFWDAAMSRRAFVERAAALGVASLAAAPLVAGTAREIAKTFPVHGTDAQTVFDKLSAAPYVSIGTGLPVYVLTSARCPYCQAMYREYPDKVASLELRYITIPLTFEESGEIVRVWQSRSPSLFHAYMQHRLVGTPPIRAVGAKRIPSVPAVLDDYFVRTALELEDVKDTFKRAYPSAAVTGTPSFYFGLPNEMVVAGGGDKMAVVADLARALLLSRR